MTLNTYHRVLQYISFVDDGPTNALINGILLVTFVHAVPPLSLAALYHVQYSTYPKVRRFFTGVVRRGTISVINNVSIYGKRVLFETMGFMSV